MAQVNACVSNEELSTFESERKRFIVSRSRMARAMIAIGLEVAKTDPERVRSELLRQIQDDPAR